MEFETSLEELSWIPQPRISALRRLQITNIGELLTHYPRRHEDRREFPRFPSEETTGPVCLCGEVVKTRLMRFGGRRIFELMLQEDGAHALSQPLTCRWFNLHYVQKMVATGQRLVVFGRVKLRGMRLVVDHPEFEVIETDDEMLIHFRRITPIYPATEGVSQRVLRSIMFRLLEEIDLACTDVLLPPDLNNGVTGHELRKIHFPESTDQLRDVREHLVLGEFFRMQVQIASNRLENRRRDGQRHLVSGQLAERFLAALPFALTNAQQRVLEEIRADLHGGSPMNRLLQGDVASGKTVVAIAAMLLVVESGSQAVLMAPTQILAEQHYALLRFWLDRLGIRLSLHTGARREESFLPLIQGDEAQIVVGTHALLYEGVHLQKLGLAVIDEQHKFGVSQRAKLTSREPAPDVLVMTATPIPRTLTMTIYGNLDVSTIDQMPERRGDVCTRVLEAGNIGPALRVVRGELACGGQAYIIYPLIDESGKLEAKAATTEFQRWQERLRPFTCELVHGRMQSVEKQSAIERFRTGDTQALISTTVLEVGIDVPNATVMLIENAERFGISQLHQLRGRIGRGPRTSHCLLLTADQSPETVAKLSVLEKTRNGFEIAEADWELRGPGELLGTAQSGLPEFKLGDLRRDAALMRRARTSALRIFESDPELRLPENQRFRSLIVEKGQTYSHVS